MTIPTIHLLVTNAINNDVGLRLKATAYLNQHGQRKGADMFHKAFNHYLAQAVGSNVSKTAVRAAFKTL